MIVMRIIEIIMIFMVYKKIIWLWLRWGLLKELQQKWGAGKTQSQRLNHNKHQNHHDFDEKIMIMMRICHCHIAICLPEDSLSHCNNSLSHCKIFARRRYSFAHACWAKLNELIYYHLKASKGQVTLSNIHGK